MAPNVTEVIPGDDISSIRDYQPHQASGPFHIINLILNQTVDSGSRLRKRDRNGTSLAVSPIGLSIGEQWHGAWTSASHAATVKAKQPLLGVRRLGGQVASDHPLVDELGASADRAEQLSLRQWIAISGAAVDPGRGRTTKLGTALLMGLVNLRTGYWWDSGIAQTSRSGFPDLSLMRRILYLIPRFFTTQSLVLFEWLARYPGPWQRFWHLGDGGFFENLGAYELVRRRVPRIIICDSSADPEYEFACLAELVRKVRIDFGAIIESFDKKQIPDAVRSYVGTLKDLKPVDRKKRLKRTRMHAALLWCHFPNTNEPSSVILYIKSSLTGDESEDLKNYQREHPQFPHEPTTDQFFDEPQWECYRQLGFHAASKLFKCNWFWQFPLPRRGPE